MTTCGRTASAVFGAAGYALVLAAVAGMAARVRIGRALDRILFRPIERQAGRCWGENQ